MTNEERAELNRLLALRDNEALPIAGRAWNAIKKPDDNSWIDLPVDMKGKLSNLAEKYAAGNPEAEGDYAPAGFFDAVRAQTGQQYPMADPAFVASVAERNPVLQGQDAPPIRLVPGEGREFRPDPPTGGLQGTFSVDPASKSATVNVNHPAFSEDTSSHAPNDNVVPTDPDGPPVVDTKGQAPPVEVPALGTPGFDAAKFNSDLHGQPYRAPRAASDWVGSERRVADLPIDHPERRGPHKE